MCGPIVYTCAAICLKKFGLAVNYPRKNIPAKASPEQEMELAETRIENRLRTASFD